MVEVDKDLLKAYQDLVDELHRNGISRVEITEDGYAKITKIEDGTYFNDSVRVKKTIDDCLKLLEGTDTLRGHLTTNNRKHSPDFE